MDMLSTFTLFDWVVVGLLLLMAFGGLMRGFTQEAISLAGWVLAVVVVRIFHEQATLWLAPKTGGEASAATVAFILLFFGTALLARIAASFAGGVARRSPLAAMDRLLGLGFGAVKGLILAAALFLMLQFSTGLFDADRQPPQWLRESRSAPLLGMAADAMVGWVQTLDASPPAETTGQPADQLPPGHPQMAPNWPGRNEQGYSRSDRDALDRLLREGAKKGEQVEI